MIWGVLQFPGSCDERDALHACAAASGESLLIWHRDSDLSKVDGIVVPGGFSYGDYLRAGALARFSPAMTAVARFAAEGGPVLGICNGFQVLCEAGLLPGALLRNVELRFICKQVELETIGGDGERLSIPMKHGEGRYYAPPQLLAEIEERGQVAYRYADGHNANGSVNDIAGVRNEAGNVVGLMPHPEHAIDPLTGSTDGLRVFRALERFAS
ncbi:MAG: phosphoribosylformylglycinamidine synthase subunit PurQ [Actinobacteria bacterium]|nr:phosphoribosylformylglycinamidine synthase subunit PurQ [Actinomycetota bacterium]